MDRRFYKKFAEDIPLSRPFLFMIGGETCFKEGKQGVKGILESAYLPTWCLAFSVLQVTQAYFSVVFFGMTGACLKTKALTASGYLF